jgi:hypothetical protein
MNVTNYTSVRALGDFEKLDTKSILNSECTFPVSTIDDDRRCKYVEGLDSDVIMT